MRQKYLKPIAWVFKLYWKSSKLALLWISLKTIFDGLINIAITYGLAKFIASVSAVAFQKGSENDVYLWLIITLLIALFKNLVEPADRLIRTKLDNNIEIAGVEHFIKKIYDLSQEQFDNQEFNTKIDRARDGFYRLSRSVNTLSGVVSSLIGFVGSIGAVMLASPIVGIITIIAIIPTIVINRKDSRRYEEANRKTEPYDRTGYRIRWIISDPLYMPEIRLMQAFKDLLNIWKTNTKKSQDIYFETSKISAKYGIITDFISALLNAGNSLYLFKLVVGGVIGFDKFIFLRGMFEQAQSTVSSLSYYLKEVYEQQIALQNYSEIFNTQPAIPNGHIEPVIPLKIEFKNVSFKYPSSKVFAIENVSFVINPGEKIALVGENGAGKTTIVKLMLRQYLPTSGTILINNDDIRDINQEAYFKAMSSLNQEFYSIGSLSIKDNLTLGLDRVVTNEEIFKITDMVGATDFLQKLPHKLNSRLDPSFDNGTDLSGGQKQRLGIARTLLRNGDIMILDEPTSSIDAKAEYFIFNNIFSYHADKTTLIISHRFSTVRKANKIFVLENGKIIEKGSHSELLQINGLYKEMFDKQAEGYK